MNLYNTVTVITVSSGKSHQKVSRVAASVHLTHTFHPVNKLNQLLVYIIINMINKTAALLSNSSKETTIAFTNITLVLNLMFPFYDISTGYDLRELPHENGIFVAVSVYGQMVERYFEKRPHQSGWMNQMWIEIKFVIVRNIRQSWIRCERRQCCEEQQSR